MALLKPEMSVELVEPERNANNCDSTFSSMLRGPESNVSSVKSDESAEDIPPTPGGVPVVSSVKSGESPCAAPPVLG